MRLIPTIVGLFQTLIPIRLASTRDAYLSSKNSPFGREVDALHAGIIRYESERDGNAGNRTLLRRNIHRLEKALTMIPRRKIFAIDFILETVETYSKLVTYHASSMHRQADDSTLRATLLDIEYADAVLQAYFDAVDIIAETDQARALYLPASIKFKATIGEVRERFIGQHVVPFQRSIEEPLVDFTKLKQLALRRRSVRWFEQKPVSRELIDQALIVGSQAPSACNRQPFRFIVLDEPAAIADIASIPMGTKGYEHQIPVFVVVIGQQRHFHDPRDRHVIYIDASLAVMGTLFAVETLGLGACCINWPDIDAKEIAMKQKLGLEDDERPVMCLAIGWPRIDALVASSPKKELDEIRSYNPTKPAVASNQRRAA